VYPLWDIAIAPVIRAAMPKRIVEIGALRGETTTLMLESLGSEVELHVIDPVPEFDPTEHEQRFPGRYIFHRDISHNVLPQLEAVDVALIDGDHNWYTVYHELRMLRDSARAAGASLPVLIMHDVLWPYGRRDLYYDPQQIPEEFRHPYASRGIAQGRSELMPPRGGGVNPTMNNALHEGGPRNGVMTAFDDFLAEHDKAVRKVLIPIYFGLLVVVEEERLAAHPALEKALDELESAEVRNELLELSEQLRLRALALQHRVFFNSQRRIPQLTRRYLDNLKTALLNQHYLENEVRLKYLADCAREGRKVDSAKLQDPARNLKAVVQRTQAERRAGTRPPRGVPASWLPFAPIGRLRLDHLESCLDGVREARVGGDMVSCGTSRGGDAVFMAGYLEAHDMTRRVWVADPLKGPLRTSKDREDELSDQSGDLNLVREAFARFDLLDDRVRFLQGAFAETLQDAPITKIALLRVEAEDTASVTTALDTLYDRVAQDGWVLVDGFRNPASLAAVKEFRARRGISEPLERIDGDGVCWRKATPAEAAETAATTTSAPARAPLAPPAPADPIDLTVIVVFYNMRREAERTLHSLSRAYQQGIDDLTYEVIVIENGSRPDQKLGHDYVRSFGPEFTYVDLGDDATPSPVNALNTGMARARGEAVAFMIDGAHVLTPGVLRLAMQGLRQHEPAMVVTQQWYVGPGQQPDVGLQGYDQAYEDRLFEKIQWPVDGYRLFKIGHFIGERDWFDGLWESNCIFVPRELLQQVGGMNESFSVAGGGYANLEFYERIGTHPGLTVVSILGEGSFHQVHGGTTTNEVDVEERNRRLVSYREHYAELKGRHFTGHGKPIHYVGSLTEGSRRTRPRRMTSQEYWKEVGHTGPDGFPSGPIPMPEELKDQFTDSFWHTLDWQETTWLGHKVQKCPTDLLAYQDLVVRLRPRWIVETGTGTGGRALFFASVCDLIDHGSVLSIDAEPDADRPTHPRITYLTADPLAPETMEQITAIVGTEPDALVVLGMDSRERLFTAFDRYAELVPTGSYVIVEDTVVNGHPVWTSHGPGPAEAVKNILKTRTDFGADPLLEKYELTFNPGGFLKRLSGGSVQTPASPAAEGRRRFLRGKR
jgi:cephalosporin hydroxylase